MKLNRYTYKGSGSTIFASLLSKGQLLKERICSSRSKFLPLRVDSIFKSYLMQRSKQEVTQLNTNSFLKKKAGRHLLERERLLGLIQ